MFIGAAVVVIELAIVLLMVFMILEMFVLMCCGPADEQISVGVVSADEVIVMDCVGDVLELLSLDPFMLRRLWSGARPNWAGVGANMNFLLFGSS